MAKLDQTLVESAIELLESRFPASEGIAASGRTDDGHVLTSVVFDPGWGGGGLCAETGAILEAHKLSKQIVAIACVYRLSGKAPSSSLLHAAFVKNGYSAGARPLKSLSLTTTIPQSGSPRL